MRKMLDVLDEEDVVWVVLLGQGYMTLVDPAHTKVTAAERDSADSLCNQSFVGSCRFALLGESVPQVLGPCSG
jgi:hypothetical protein